MSATRIDRDLILATALALVDREGLDQLTMRRLASELNIEAPSLYKHVLSKDDILDGLTDLVYAEVEVGSPGESWRDRVVEYATALRRALLAHPNVVPVVAARPVLGDSTLLIGEVAIGELVALGLQPRDARRVFDIIFAFIVGHAMAEVGPQIGGVDREKAQEVQANLDPDRFPLLAATLADMRADRDAEFLLGVRMLSAGIEQLLA